MCGRRWRSNAGYPTKIRRWPTRSSWTWTPAAGSRRGVRWKDALARANTRCEAVICLLSHSWEASRECQVEYRTAENLNKQILCARLEDCTGRELTSEWQRVDLFGPGPHTSIQVGGGPPVVLATDGLLRLRDAIRGPGISAEAIVATAHRSAFGTIGVRAPRSAVMASEAFPLRRPHMYARGSRYGHHGLRSRGAASRPTNRYRRFMHRTGTRRPRSHPLDRSPNESVTRDTRLVGLGRSPVVLQP